MNGSAKEEDMEDMRVFEWGRPPTQARHCTAALCIPQEGIGRQPTEPSPARLSTEPAMSTESGLREDGREHQMQPFIR